MGSLGPQGWVKEHGPEWEAGGSWRARWELCFKKPFPSLFQVFAFQGLSLCFRRLSRSKVQL